jgi:hypothetical protein
MTRISYEQRMGDVPDADIVLPKNRSRRFRIKPEDALQVECVKLIRDYQRAHPGALQYIVVQPERTNPQPQRRDWLKKLGIFGNSGHQEILLFHNDARRDWFIELKAPDGRMSSEQLDWQTWAIATGRNQCVVRSVEQFAAILAAF